MSNVAVFRFLAFAFGFVGSLLIVVSTPTHYWYLQKVAYNGTKYGGIWEDCTEERDVYSCTKVTKSEWLNAVKAFMVLSIIGILATVIYMVVMVWAKGLNVRYIGLFLLFAGLNSLIAVIIYTAKRDLQGGFVYSGSYIICWIGSCFLFFASVLCYFGNVEYEQMK